MSKTMEELEARVKRAVSGLALARAEFERKPRDERAYYACDDAVREDAAAHFAYRQGAKREALRLADMLAAAVLSRGGTPELACAAAAKLQSEMLAAYEEKLLIERQAVTPCGALYEALENEIRRVARMN